MKGIPILLLFLLITPLLSGCETETSVPETIAPTVIVSEEPQTPTTAPLETEPEEECFLLTFVGDCPFGASPAHY